MAWSTLNEKANGSRLSRLLVDKGTQALRQAFDVKHPPISLPAVLITNKPTLQRLRYKVINPSQWKLLYPPSGPPDSNTFDVTLLTILLRQICGLTSPIAGWSTMPPDSDTSISANILRIKMFRNEVYAHVTTTEIDDNTFEKLSGEISKALVALGIPSSEMDELREEPLSPEEDGYIWQLKEWKKDEDELINIARDTNVTLKEMEKRQAAMEALIENLQRETNLKSSGSDNVSDVDKLAKCDFTGNIRKLSSLFQEETRTWLFSRLDSWLTDSESQVMVLTAGPGIGKSVFAAKVCEMYQKIGKLAACHFCKFNNSDYGNPHTLLQSLASQMCDNVEGFKDKLDEQLRRTHCRQKLSEAFRVLLNGPLYALEERDPMLIVIDALDESEVEGKSEFLELISEEFSSMPKWIKILITSRPELPIHQKLSHFNPVEIHPDDEYNEADLFLYLKSCLSKVCASDDVLSSLVMQCQGSFLYAYFVQLQLQDIDVLTIYSIANLVPKGISAFYEKQFKRLKDNLSPLNVKLTRFINILVAAKGPLPLVLLEECLELSTKPDFELRNTVIEMMSSFLPVYGDCLTVFHRSLIDWLKSDGYSSHAFTADAEDGARHLWYACENVFNDVVNLEVRSDLKLTPRIKYALEYGTSHLFDVDDDKKKYDWLVDMKLNHVKTSVFPRDSSLFRECKRVLYSSPAGIPSHTLRKIWRLLTMMDCVEFESRQSYLQAVANGLAHRNEDEDDTNIARSLLEKGKYVWCEDLNSRHFPNRLLTSWVDAPVRCVGISPKNQFAAVGHLSGGIISILKLPSLEILYKYNSEIQDGVPCCTFSPDSSVLLYGSVGFCLDVRHHKQVRFFPDYSDHFESCSFSSSGGRLVTADDSRFVKLWDVKQQTLLTCIDAGVSVDDCFFSNCGLFIVGKKNSGSMEYILAIWNALTLHRVDRRYFDVSNLSKSFSSNFGFDWFFPPLMSEENTEIIVSRKPDSSNVFVFYLPHGVPICFLRDTKGCIVTRFTENCNSLLTYKSRNNSLIVVDPVQKKLLAECRIQWLSSLAISPIVVCNKTLIVQEKLSLLSLEIPDQLVFSNPRSYVTITCCSFSPDGLWFATYNSETYVSIWDVKMCKVTKTFSEGFGALACWWWEHSLWFIFPTYIAKITLDPIPVILRVLLGDRTAKSATFAEGILIVKFNEFDSIGIAKITNDCLLSSMQMRRTRHVFDSLAIGPGGSCILLASTTKFKMLKERTCDNSGWRHFCDGDLNPLSFESLDDLSRKAGKELFSKCCITCDGKFGVIVVFFGDLHFKNCLGYFIVNLTLHEIVKSIAFPKDHIAFESPCSTVYASRYHLVFQNSLKVFILKLQDGKVAAMWSRQGGPIQSFPTPALGFSSRHNLIAIPQADGYITFVEIHCSETL